ncbi:MAG: class I SAM-dependent methyltransferase [Agromyces sp.]
MDVERTDASGTEHDDYAERLAALQSVWWKRVLPVQLPYRWNIRRLHLGRTLDVGCGIGRNLLHLDDAVGVDHNPRSIEIARERGLTAFSTEEFRASPFAVPDAFDSILVAHVLEHMSHENAKQLLADYTPFLRPGGRVCMITPQERGYASDPTHVEFVDFDAIAALCDELGFTTERSYSFPAPRSFGRSFIYNEFVVVAVKA